MENTVPNESDRVVKSVQAPPLRPLTFNLMYPDPEKPDIPDINAIKNHMMQGGRIGRGELIKILTDATQLLGREPNLIYVKLPTIIVGDIHGQFLDLIHMFEKVIKNKKLSETNIVFLGDYVDRGLFSVEVIVFLYALKLNYPKQITLLRGNHESRWINEDYTFHGEVLDKYQDERIFDLFIESFMCLPVAAIVGN